LHRQNANVQASVLKEWVQLEGRNLRFVFVSACYSNLIGQAFVDAEVPHLVCCRHGCKVRDDAATQFAKSFYHYMACGKRNLRDAFEIAKAETKQNYGINEAVTFCLLPENGDHRVSIFSQSAETPSLSKESNSLPFNRNTF
jgi:hypothetical protein